MRKRSFFRYTYTPRVIAIGVVMWVLKALAIFWALRLQWLYLVWGLSIVYAIFCALFLVVSYIKWQRYCKHS